MFSNNGTAGNLEIILREYLPPNITVGIHCNLEDLNHIHVSSSI